MNYQNIFFGSTSKIAKNLFIGFFVVIFTVSPLSAIAEENTAQTQNTDSQTQVEKLAAQPVCDPNVELVQDGDFESPTVTNVDKWDVFGTSTLNSLGWNVEWISTQTSFDSRTRGEPKLELQKTGIVAGWSANTGAQYAELDTDWDGPTGTAGLEPSAIKLSQTLSTVAGQKYKITFAHAARPNSVNADDNKTSVWFGQSGSPIATVDSAVTSTTTTVWGNYSYEAVATSSQTLLAFKYEGTPDSYGSFLDTVSVKCVKDTGTPGQPPVNNAPVITLLGDNPLNIIIGTNFVDPGATATDTEDGDLTNKIVKSGTVNASTTGTYTITYSVTDSQGASASVNRTVNVNPKIITHSCLLPNYLGDTQIEAVMKGWDDISLQDQFNENSISKNVINDQKQYQTWQGGSNNISVSFEIIGASKPIAQLGHTFGYYQAGNINSFVPLFKDKATSTSQFASTSIMSAGASTSTTINANSNIGFAIFNSDGTKWASENSLNSDVDQMVAYELDSNVYIIAFEDISYYSSDRDFNDLVIKVTVNGCNPVNNPAPTVTLNANPNTIQTGASTTLTWTSTNANSCSALWTSATSTSGSFVLYPATTTEYAITCTGNGGSATATTTVTVTANPVPQICDATQELLSNGGFEIPNISTYTNPQWTLVPWGTTNLVWQPSVNAYALEIQRGLGGWSAYEGSQWAEIDGANAITVLNRASTTPGYTYKVTLAYSARPGLPVSDNRTSVSANGVTLGSFSDDGTNATTTHWKTKEYSFVATSSNSFVGLTDDRAVSNGAGMLIDAVSVKCVGKATNTPPTITLIGANPFEMTVNTPFVDPGATANDAEDGNLTSQIVKTGTVNASSTGTYTLTYTVTDSGGLSASTTRTVIVKPVSVPPTPTVTLNANPSTINPGATSTLTWTSNNTTSCAAAWTNATSTSGSMIVSPATTTDYAITCTGSNGSATATTTITVTTPNGNPTPSVTLNANPSSIDKGQSSTLTWSSANVTSCSAAWTSATSTSGSQAVSPTATTDYSISCTGNYGTVSATTTVKVNSDNGGGGGGGTPGGHRHSITTGEVLGTSTCSYLEDYLKIDWKNNPVEVFKLQSFLKNFEGFSNLQVNGVFDQPTFDAVSKFQVKYFGDVLQPWGHKTSTGFVYILTKKKVNEIYCQMPFPVTSLQQQEIDAFRTFLASIGNPSSSDYSTNYGDSYSYSGAFGATKSESVDSNVLGTSTKEINKATSTKTSILGSIGNIFNGDPIRNAAISMFAFTGKTASENVKCAVIFIGLLILVYIVSSLVGRSVSDENRRKTKIISFIIGSLIMIAMGVIAPLYCIILPFIAALLIALGMFICAFKREHSEMPEEIVIDEQDSNIA